MRLIFFVLLTVSSIFADCYNGPMIYQYQTRSGSEWASDMGTPPVLTPTCNDTEKIVCSWKNGFVEDTGRVLIDRICKHYQKVSECPSGQSPSSTGECTTPPPPKTCPWATTPPYSATGLTEPACHNAHGPLLVPDDTRAYGWNYSWCPADTTCYARQYWCPKGTVFNNAVGQCTQPWTNKPDGYCKSGWVISNRELNGVCYSKKCCKDNPTVCYEIAVSCGSGPVDPGYPGNPDAPQTPKETEQAPSGYDDHSAKCGTEKLLAQSSCQAPNILSFSCDPKTGTVLKSTCTPPNNPNPDGSAPGDDTKGATTKDIKDLGDNLPKKIKDAFRDFFMDGSENLLSSIGEYTKTQTILQADSNDKLDAIHASANAELNAQYEANTKLDGIKNSIDNIKPSSDGMTNQPFNGFNDSSLISDAPDNTSVLDDIKSFSDQLVTDATSIGTQFESAKSQIQNGISPVNLPIGGCSDISFSIPGSSVSTSIPMSRVPGVIAPYSPIFSLLVYVSVMFYIFKFLFLFYISRSK